MDSDKKTGTRPRILIADDHAVFTEALRLFLERSYDVVGFVEDGRALLAKAPQLNPDLVILDIGMPMLNGVDAARRLLQALPKVKIVFMTMYEDANLVAAACSLGKVGFVLKHSHPSELLKAIEAALKNQSYVSPKIRPTDWKEQAHRARQFTAELTPRQAEIVQLLAEGRAPKEIAALLNVSLKTVMFHKYHVMDIFNLRSNADVVLFALQKGLIMPMRDSRTAH